MASSQAKAYEVTYLLPVSLTDAEATRVKDTVLASIKKHKGEVVETQEWGKRKLAYQLKHGGHTHGEAHYVHVVVKFEGPQVMAFEKDLYLNTSLMRHLLVVSEPSKAQPKVAVEETVSK